MNVILTVAAETQAQAPESYPAWVWALAFVFVFATIAYIYHHGKEPTKNPN